MSTDQLVEQLVENAIKENKTVIFSKSWCPYCKKAKALLASDSPKVYELDERDDGAAIQSYLKTKTGQSTVPNVFIDEKHIGGSDKVEKYVQART